MARINYKWFTEGVSGLAMADPAELFEAISHPERIKILKILKKEPSSFASLKRQLGIKSSGNLDYHLKKLSQLVTVQADGSYGLTDAGKEALLSIEAIEMWTEMEKRRIKMPSRMPKEAFFLELLNLCTTTSVVLFFLPIMQVPLSLGDIWGKTFFAALLLLGYWSTIGIFFRWKWSWTMVLSKSALIMSMSLFLLNYKWNSEITQPASVAIYYLVLVAAETAAVIEALSRPLKDFLGISTVVKPPVRTIIGSLLCIFSGILLILLESWTNFPVNTPQLGKTVTVFTSIGDPSILCGLLIVVGGVLILAGNNTLGSVMSIIFGLFPPYPYANHVYNIIANPALLYTLFIAVAVGSLPVVGGLLALAEARKIRR
jgi:DNA-binding transcriptional ArsR family regulator